MIQFELTEVPTRAAEKNITENPYWPVIQSIKDLGQMKAAKFPLPREEDDTPKKAVNRARNLLNEISKHIGRTIRLNTSEPDALGIITASVWVMDKKIARKDTPAEAPTEDAPTDNAPADAPTEDAPTEDTPEATPEPEVTEAPADDTMVGRRGRRNRN